MRGDDPNLRSDDALLRWEALRRQSEPQPKPKAAPVTIAAEWEVFIKTQIDAALGVFSEVVGEETTRAILLELGSLLGEKLPLIAGDENTTQITFAVAEEMREKLISAFKRRVRQVAAAERHPEKQKVTLVDASGLLDRRVENAVEKALQEMRQQIASEVRKQMRGERGQERGQVLDLPAVSSWRK